MTLEQVAETVQSHFNTQWAGQTPIAWDNVAFDESSQNSAWVRFSFQSTSGTIASLGEKGSRRFRSFGLIFVQVYTPIDANRKENDNLARTAKLIFQGEQLGTIWFRNESIISIGSEGKWYQQNVSIEVIYDETET